MNQIPSDEIVGGGMNAAATNAVVQPSDSVVTRSEINVAQSALDDLSLTWPVRAF